MVDAQFMEEQMKFSQINRHEWLQKELLIKLVYVSLGLFIGLVIVALSYSKIQYAKEKTMIYISSFNSCYMGMSQAKPLDRNASEFCDKFAIQSSENYAEISKKMDEILDSKDIHEVKY